MPATIEELQDAFRSRGQNPKYRLEGWISGLTALHSCLGLNWEGDSHPDCKQVLQVLVKDIEEVMKTL